MAREDGFPVSFNCSWSYTPLKLSPLSYYGFNMRSSQKNIPTRRDWCHFDLEIARTRSIVKIRYHENYIIYELSIYWAIFASSLRIQYLRNLVYDFVYGARHTSHPASTVDSYRSEVHSILISFLRRPGILQRYFARSRFLPPRPRQPDVGTRGRDRQKRKEVKSEKKKRNQKKEKKER